MRLNQVLLRAVLKGSRINDILLKLRNRHHMTPIEVSSGYHNLRIKKSSYLTTLACQFGRYRFTRLPFRVVPVGNMFQLKINEILRGLPNVFGIADDILIVKYDADGRDLDMTLRQAMQICWKENPELKK